MAQTHHALDRSPEDAHAGLRGGPAREDQRCALAPWQVRRLRDHVEAHLHRNLPVPELAAVARRSSSHFSRAFKVSFGLSPHAYVVRRRLARAMAMMCGTTETLAQIAIACGCSDQAHFCRLFRDAMACTPREWRRRHADA